VQTVSAQVRELERALGQQLLKPAGRGLALTDAGHAALHQADQIFALGAQLPARVRDAVAAPQVRLAVGIGDGLSKLVVQQLLQPVLDVPQLRLLCHEDEFDRLLADLALHRLDVVLSDRPAPAHRSLRVYSHALGTAPLAWYAPAALAAQIAPADGTGASLAPHLATAPVLLPTGHAALRPRLDAWFERRGVVPRIVGEFEDSALMVTFAAAGMGVFPAPAEGEDTLRTRYGLQRIADGDGLADQFFAIATEKKVLHPLVQRLLPA
jgi:LysR family transcriptional activator of nhaA